MADEVHMSWGLSTDHADPQSEILYEFYLNGVLNPDVIFGSSGFVYCREASGFTTVEARAVDTSGNRSEPSNEIVVQCPYVRSRALARVRYGRPHGRPYRFRPG
jgi:hypothetical protein